MDEKPKEHSSSFRVRIHKWWSNLKNNYRKNVQMENLKEKEKAEVSQDGVEAQIESMKRTN